MKTITIARTQWPSKQSTIWIS